MTNLATRNCASSPSFQSAGTVQVGLSVAVVSVWAASPGIAGCDAGNWLKSIVDGAASFSNSTDFKKATNAGLFFSTKAASPSILKYQAVSSVCKIAPTMRSASPLPGLVPTMSYKSAGLPATSTGSASFFTSNSSTGDCPTCPRQRVTFAASPPAMPPRGITLTSADLPFSEISKLATRNCVKAFSFQPSGKVYFNFGRPELSGAGKLSGMVAGIPPGDAGGGSVTTALVESTL